MFTGEHNPVQHMVINGACLYCKQELPGNGVVYTKEGHVIPTPSLKFNVCGE